MSGSASRRMVSFLATCLLLVAAPAAARAQSPLQTGYGDVPVPLPSCQSGGGSGSGGAQGGRGGSQGGTANGCDNGGAAGAGRRGNVLASSNGGSNGGAGGSGDPGAGGGGATATASSGSLPFTGANVGILAICGLACVAVGLALRQVRRRPGDVR